MSRHKPQVPKVFHPQAGDVRQVHTNAEFFAIDPEIVSGVAAGLHEALEGPVYPGVTPAALAPIRGRDLFERGGTLIAPDVRQIAASHPDFGIAFHGLQRTLGHEVGQSGNTIKVYAGKKAGKGAHRDANFDNTTPSVVDAIGIEGTREFGLWAIPQTVQLRGSDRDFMNTASRNRAMVEFTGTLDGDDYLFRPVSTQTLGPGEGARLDEVHSTWQQPNGREMALWHSVYGTVDQEQPGPVVSAVFRSANPSEISHRVDLDNQPPRLF